MRYGVLVQYCCTHRMSLSIAAHTVLVQIVSVCMRYGVSVLLHTQDVTQRAFIMSHSCILGCYIIDVTHVDY